MTETIPLALVVIGIIIGVVIGWTLAIYAIKSEYKKIVVKVTAPKYQPESYTHDKMSREIHRVIIQEGLYTETENESKRTMRVQFYIRQHLKTTKK